MTSWIIRALFALFVLAPAFAAEPPIVVGAVVSQTGMLADLADGYRKGLLVWQDEVNAAGGVRGRNVELRLLDDGSEAARNSALYQQLIRDDKADALIGPYGTAATLMAAAEADNYVLQVVKAINAEADAWIAFGQPRDAADMVRTLKRVGFAPKLFFARAAADPKFIELVGQDAEFSLAAAEYHPRLKTNGNDRFVKLYSQKWSSPPNAAAAQVYAAATGLGEALRRSGSADQEKLRAALAALELDTVLGRYKVDPKTGEQTGIKAAVVQIETGRPLAVWPPELRAAKPVLPYPQWRERELLR